jgi:hypothetical protein
MRHGLNIGYSGSSIGAVLPLVEHADGRGDHLGLLGARRGERRHGELRLVRVVEARYPDFSLGLADCALVTLADRHRTTRILTFDERHFRAVRGPGGRAFRLLPADG